MKSIKVNPLFLAMAVSMPTIAQETEPTPEVLEEVLVTGFRQSIAKALDTKRNSANNVESIVAEDIGKMPDLNLAESLQRSPGIAITREGGEGRQITVRGLGPQYTRVTMNGMEVPSSAGGTDSSGGTNRGRPFDFNVFGSELFSNIVINKSPVGHIEEGGLASTVELFSHSPLDNPGLTMAGSIQGGYNANTGELAPRLSGLISNTFMDDKVGVLAAINYSDREVRQDGFGSVRWTAPESNIRGGPVPLGHGWANNNATINGTANALGNYSQQAIDARGEAADTWNTQTPAERLADPRWALDPADMADVATANSAEEATSGPLDFLWSPRLPRMDSFNRDTSRLGLAFGVEFRPTDELELGLNVLKSTFSQDTTSLNYFAQFRNTHNEIIPESVTLDTSGRIITQGKFKNVKPRSESRVQYGESDFTQIILDFNYDISDTLRVSGMLGNANATYEEDYRRYNMDVNPDAIAAAGQSLDFEYELTNGGNLANMSYGFDVDDVSLYRWNNVRVQRDDLERDYTTFKVDLVWEFDDAGSNVMVGLISNDREISSNSFQSNLTNVDNYEDEIVLNTNNTDTVGNIYGDFADGIDAPAGLPRSWLVVNFDQLYADLGSPEAQFNPTNANTYVVTEETLGLYTEVNWFIGDFLANAGLRYVETDVTSAGFSAFADGPEYTEFSSDYDNLLPSLNLTYNITDDLRARLAWSENIARPNPASLSGSVSVSPINGEVTANNPGLEPEVADSLDLSMEWYFAEESYVGFTIFSKDISDPISSESLPAGTLPPEYRAVVAGQADYQLPTLPANVFPLDSDQWVVNTKLNGDSTTNIDGWEIGYQQVFAYGIGVLANYTSVDSGDEVIDGLSENTLNLGVFWENENYGARLMMNDRDDYASRSPGRNGNLEERTTGPTRFDISSHWHINEQFTATLEIINLTDEKERLYTTGPLGDLDLVREYNTTGTEVFLGVRATF